MNSVNNFFAVEKNAFFFLCKKKEPLGDASLILKIIAPIIVSFEAPLRAGCKTASTLMRKMKSTTKVLKCIAFIPILIIAAIRTIISCVISACMMYLIAGWIISNITRSGEEVDDVSSETDWYIPEQVPYLGFDCVTNYERGRFCLVTNVELHAEKAGLKKGDIVKSINGSDIKGGSDDLDCLLRCFLQKDMSIGDKVDLVITRKIAVADLKTTSLVGRHVRYLHSNVCKLLSLDSALEVVPKTFNIEIAIIDKNADE